MSIGPTNVSGKVGTSPTTQSARPGSFAAASCSRGKAPTPAAGARSEVAGDALHLPVAVAAGIPAAAASDLLRPSRLTPVIFLAALGRLGEGPLCRRRQRPAFMGCGLRSCAFRVGHCLITVIETGELP